MIIGELGVGVATSKHHVSQGVPARLDRGQVLELAVRVGDGAQQVEVWALVHPEHNKVFAVAAACALVPEVYSNPR